MNIISKLVTPDGYVSEPCLTGYLSLQDAERALAEDWPRTTLNLSNVLIMADYDGSRLVLQRVAK